MKKHYIYLNVSFISDLIVVTYIYYLYLTSNMVIDIEQINKELALISQKIQLIEKALIDAKQVKVEHIEVLGKDKDNALILGKKEVLKSQEQL